MTHNQKCDLFFWVSLVPLILCFLGIPVITWLVFSPDTFWQRLASVIIGIVFMGISILPLLGIMYLTNEWFDQWLVRRRKRRERGR